MATGPFEVVLELAGRYDLQNELRRRGAESPYQLLHTHGYREFLDLAAVRSKSLDALTNG